MVIAVLVVLGLCFGSFVNAFVWRLHERRDWVHERSECVHCHHELAAKDLVPVLSWLWLGGRCRYCHKPISAQYPLVEATTAGLFIVSYAFWPYLLLGGQWVVFGLWLIILTGLLALFVYDLRWMLLPNKLVFPLTVLALVMQAALLATDWKGLAQALTVTLAVAIGGGIFYILFQVSDGKWIGGGDVKLGFLLGLLAGTPAKSLLVIFLAALVGSVVSLPLLANKKLGRKSSIPFGPFLIIGGIITVLFGNHIIDWYTHAFILGG
ncbi:MAG TPA: prepilin peptidase [Candidatus Saccharimonadales bacterium]|nr:prepilin peptidase [Candidatus Saccharimonadales bacterium]